MNSSTLNTYLFVWNPHKWKWPELSDDCATVQRGGRVEEEWNCVSHKKVRRGDRAFFSRVGSDPRGIFASGHIVSEPFLSKSRKGKDIYHVRVSFDLILDPDKEAILTVDILNIGKLAKQLWTPQASGISIKPGLTEELEALWRDFLENEKAST